jgi:Protein of unknown function (DUF742)
MTRPHAEPDRPPPPRLVRPYVVTRGRTAASGAPVPLDAAVHARREPEELDVTTTPEARRIVALCVAPVSLAELAARLPLPVGAVRVLVGDLRTSGAVTVRDAPAVEAARDVSLLQRLLDGIRAL